MPFVSRAQARWGNSPAGLRALGGRQKVDEEWNQSTDFSQLPEKQPMAKHWIAGAIKHPGALTAAAREHGRSKLAEAEAEKHSKNPKVRARGALGARFIRKEI
jgi:hypothetical protein